MLIKFLSPIFPVSTRFLNFFSKSPPPKTENSNKLSFERVEIDIDLHIKIKNKKIY